MPIFALQTNVPSEQITADLLKEISRKVGQLLQKPESYVTVHIQGSQTMTFAGSTDPCAYGTLKSIGGLGGKLNKSHAKALYEVVSKTLGISGDRMYIEFIDLDAENVAFNGTTFG